ncbi:MAG: xanthine dehydrogenase family protein molybdopterin-binding subunit [Anaeromyxobacteraceae bacterium]
MTARVGRRTFLGTTALGGAGLWLSLALPDRAEAAPRAAALEPNAWLRVGTDGVVTVFLAKAEMGQGVFTSMPMLVAEDLEADWAKVKVVQADALPRFGPMLTGGSSSVRRSWKTLREAGATARVMLVAAAARRWKVDPSTCRAERGEVIHGPSGRRLGYGALAAAAAKEPVPKEVALKPPEQFRIIGQRLPRVDTPDKTNGKARFGLDVSVPGMRYAAVARPPVLGGKVKAFDAKAALAVSGVEQVVQVPSGVAVVARSTWAALRGRERLAATFEAGPNGAVDQAEVRRRLVEAPVQTGWARKEGDVAAALAGAARRLEATYEVPFLAHATMEPMNATAHVKRGAVELWAPTQAPTWAIPAVAKALGIPEAAVTLHVTLLGGGFGRRAMWDFVVEAAEVSRAAGVPVKVTWTREDDMRGDWYRPPGVNELSGGLDAAGRLVAWTHRVRAPSASASIFGPEPRPGRDRPDVVEGAADVPYAAGALRVDCAVPDVGVRLGWWRSVYSSQNAFPEECFLDELAAAAGTDPLAFRLAHLPAASRLRGVLELAAAKAGWRTAPPPGRARGIACHASFGSYVAEVAEVSLEGGRPRVHRVTCAFDCGLVVNPDTVEAQAESAIAYGLGAALRNAITVEGGAVVQGNFDGFEPIRMNEMPAIDVHILPSKEPPGGVGEPATPPIAPAVANALFALTGKRLRRLPLGAAEKA